MKCAIENTLSNIKEKEICLQWAFMKYYKSKNRLTKTLFNTMRIVAILSHYPSEEIKEELNFLMKVAVYI